MTNYFDCFQRAVTYIETHLTEPITFEKISNAACLSGFHFSRVFHLYLGETLSSYIRKRRLSEAAKVLVETDLPILEIALRYQFESQEAFTRSFKRQFHMTPAKLRKYGKLIRWGEMPPFSNEKLTHILQGGVTLNPVIVDQKELIIIGMKCVNTMRHLGIPTLWRKFMSHRAMIPNMVDGTTYGIYLYDLNIEKKDITDELEFEYLAGVEVTTETIVPKGMMVYKIPARTYAVFTHKGRLMELQKTYDYIYKTWLPGSGIDFLPAEHFEYHGPDFVGDTPESETRIFIPVNNKSNWGVTNNQ